jgi:hypothetical protein
MLTEIYIEALLVDEELADLALNGNDQAMTFLQEDLEAGLAGETATGADWTREIPGLYLRK